MAQKTFLQLQKSEKTAPWVLFKWNQAQVIHQVVIYNRRDCCQERLFPLQIHVIDDAGGQKLCQDKTFDVGDKEIPHENQIPISIDCGGLMEIP